MALEVQIRRPRGTIKAVAFIVCHAKAWPRYYLKSREMCLMSAWALVIREPWFPRKIVKRLANELLLSLTSARQSAVKLLSMITMSERTSPCGQTQIAF
jgi:hypothetical protein